MNLDETSSLYEKALSMIFFFFFFERDDVNDQKEINNFLF